MRRRPAHRRSARIWSGPVGFRTPHMLSLVVHWGDAARWLVMLAPFLIGAVVIRLIQRRRIAPDRGPARPALGVIELGYCSWRRGRGFIMVGGTHSVPVLITGCSSGIGRAAAISLHAAGLTVYATARQVDAMADLAREGIHTLALDVNRRGFDDGSRGRR